MVGKLWFYQIYIKQYKLISSAIYTVFPSSKPQAICPPPLSVGKWQEGLSWNAPIGEISPAEMLLLALVIVVTTIIVS